MPRQHQSKQMKKVFRELERLGFDVERKKSGTYRIIPPPSMGSVQTYTTHGTESALHPMRRDFKKLYNIQLPV